MRKVFKTKAERDAFRVDAGIIPAWRIQEARNEGRTLEALLAEGIHYGTKETKTGEGK